MNTTKLAAARPVPAPGTADMRALLHRHLDNCRARSGRAHELQCWLEAAYDVIAPRLVTTAVVVGGLALLVDQFL